MLYMKIEINMQLLKSCFILDDVANLPREEVLANFKLEFMECWKYELRDPGLKILYLFMKPIYSSRGRKYNNAEQCSTVAWSQTESKLYSKV